MEALVSFTVHLLPPPHRKWTIQEREPEVNGNDVTIICMAALVMGGGRERGEGGKDLLPPKQPKGERKGRREGTSERIFRNIEVDKGKGKGSKGDGTCVTLGNFTLIGTTVSSYFCYSVIIIRERERERERERN